VLGWANAVAVALGEPCVVPLMDTDAPLPDGAAHAVGAPTPSASSGGPAHTATNLMDFFIEIDSFSPTSPDLSDEGANLRRLLTLRQRSR
jgi:hypothetical protein